jgi:hypothetical protein
MNQAVKNTATENSFSPAGGANKGKRQSEKLFDLSTFQNPIDLCNQLLATTIELHSEAVQAATDYYGGTVRTLCAISSDLNDSGSRSFSQIITIPQETAQCRTVNAAFDLHQKITQQSIENCVDASRKLTAQLQEHVAEYCKLFQEQSAAVSKKMSKVMPVSKE